MNRNVLLLSLSLVAFTLHGSGPSLLAQSNADCLDCHSDPGLSMSRNGKEIPLFFEEGKFSRSVHKDLQCVDCHAGYDPFEIPHIDPSVGSPVDREREAQTCLRCHLHDPDVVKRIPSSAGFIAAYSDSVHGMALQAGERGSATCSDCHGYHETLRPDHPDSMLSRLNLNSTCGSCHPAAYEEYLPGTHGVAHARGVGDAPTCTSCHGEHAIYKQEDPRSLLAQGIRAADMCARCHASERVTDRYGLDPEYVRSYMDGYHGRALRAGGEGVAHCASCHSAHGIYPSSDPRSTAHQDNLAETCGSCHPGAAKGFTRGRSHVFGTRQSDPWIFWISSLYLLLIVGVVGGMAGHNALDFYRKASNKLQERRGGGGGGHAPARRGLYVRMTFSERLQHASLLTSFPILVITGFMLSYPDAWWVVPFRDHVPRFYDLRALLHQIAAVVMILGSVYHLYYVIFTQRGRELIRDLAPRFQDVRDAIGVLMYNVGLSGAKPKLDRFSYIEKAEYWALIWGTAVMVFTGFVLWFETSFINLTSVLFHDVMRVIHFYEAWLAALAILVWHIYFVIFNPDVYPMNLAWLKGTITEEEMMHEHPLELERIRQAEEAAGGRTHPKKE